MAKQSSGLHKKEKPKKPDPKKDQGKIPDENPNEPKNPFDFGGLPIRDLKKNLGCG